MKWSRAWRITILCLMLLPLLGCWDNRELNDQALQLAVGIDWTDNKTYLLSNQFALNPDGSSSDNKKKSSFYTETAEGSIPMKAVTVMQSKVTRQINRGQRRSLVIGEALARKGFREVLDYVLRNPESPLRLDLFIVRNGTASDLLKSRTPFDGQSLREYYKLHQANFGAVDVVFTNLVRTMNEGMHAGLLLPSMERVGPASEKGKNQSVYRYVGGAVMNKEPKLIGYLNQEETINALWINAIPHLHIITFPVDDGNGTVTVQFKNLKRKWTLHSDEKASMSLKLQADVILLESTSEMDFLKAGVLENLKSEMEQTTVKRMKSLIGKFQKEFKIDALGVGDTIFRNHPRRWKALMTEWNRTFPEMSFSVSTKLKFRGFGLTGGSGRMKEEGAM